MIRSREDLAEYLTEDRAALRRSGKKPRGKDLIWKYEVLLRKCEYWTNCRRGIVWAPVRKLCTDRLWRMSVRLGFFIPLNACGKGLNIAHIGPIIINRHAKLGEYCRIHAGLNIGTAAGASDQAPTIGSYVYLGPGAKLFGKITIADHIAVGANAVVNKDFLEPHVAIAGAPARVINQKGSDGLLFEP